MLLQAGSTILKKGKRTKLKQAKKQTDNTESEISLFSQSLFLSLQINSLSTLFGK